MTDSGIQIWTNKLYCFKPPTLTLMKSYLSDRSQCVFQWLFFKKGVGGLRSITRQQPWSAAFVFTNDVPLTLKNAKLTMYADGTTVCLQNQNLI